MKLIEITTSKESIPGKKSTRRQHGIFECPVCKSHIEKPITHGNRNKSCGNKECRKATFTANPDQIQNGRCKKITINDVKHEAYNKLEFYDNIKSFYQTVRNYNGYTICKNVNTLDKFIEAFYAEYASIRVDNPCASLMMTDGSLYKTIDTTSTIVLKKVVKANKDAYIGKFEWCSHKLADEINVMHETVRKNARKMFNNLEYVKFMFKVNSSSNTIILTQDQYNKLKIAILHNKAKNKSTHVYLIESKPYTKIGITYDVQSRLKSLRGSSPFPVDLVHSVEIGVNANIVESYLHKKYADKCVNNEWFDLSDSDIAHLKSTLIVGYDKDIIKELDDAIIASDYVKKMDQKERIAKNKLRYQDKLNNMRMSNIKPTIDTITNQDLSEYVNNRSAQIEANTKHGLNGTREYSLWQAMKRKAKDKGLTVCSEWIDNPAKFKEDIESKTNYNEILEQFGTTGVVGDKPTITIDKDANEYNINTISVVPLSIASANTSRNKKVEQLDKNTGDVISVYLSPLDASNNVDNVNASKVSACCRNERKTHAGYAWRYVS